MTVEENAPRQYGADQRGVLCRQAALKDWASSLPSPLFDQALLLTSVLGFAPEANLPLISGYTTTGGIRGDLYKVVSESIPLLSS